MTAHLPRILRHRALLLQQEADLISRTGEVARPHEGWHRSERFLLTIAEEFLAVASGLEEPVYDGIAAPSFGPGRKLAGLPRPHDVHECTDACPPAVRQPPRTMSALQAVAAVARVRRALLQYQSAGVQEVSIRQVLDLLDPDGNWKHSFTAPAPTPLTVQQPFARLYLNIRDGIDLDSAEMVIDSADGEKHEITGGVPLVIRSLAVKHLMTEEQARAAHPSRNSVTLQSPSIFMPVRDDPQA